MPRRPERPPREDESPEDEPTTGEGADGLDAKRAASHDRPRDLFGLIDEGDPDPAVLPAPAHPELHALARSLPPRLRFGTSSWGFPGWSGIVWNAAHTPRCLAREGLHAYAAHPLLRTVGVDRAFYRPLHRDEHAELAAQVPEAFTFVLKAWQAITRPDADERGRTHGNTALTAAAGVANPLFLDAAAAGDLVLAPAAAGLGRRAGPVVFQFPPLDLSRSGQLGGVASFLDRLGVFLARLTAGRPGPVIAVELRNRDCLAGNHGARLAGVLRSAGCVLSIAGHPALPPMDEQARAMDSGGWALEEHPVLVARWLLRGDQTYDGARRRYGPFGAIVDPDPAARAALAGLARRATDAGRPAWIIVNNKAEGSAPLSIHRLAGAVHGLSREGAGAPPG